MLLWAHQLSPRHANLLHDFHARLCLALTVEVLAVHALVLLAAGDIVVGCKSCFGSGSCGLRRGDSFITCGCCRGCRLGLSRAPNDQRSTCKNDETLDPAHFASQIPQLDLRAGCPGLMRKPCSSE